MKKYFSYFLLTAFVFNLLFLNNFALAQTQTEIETKLCYGCIQDEKYGIRECRFLEDGPTPPDNPDAIQCCTVKNGIIVTSVTDAEDCGIGGFDLNVPFVGDIIDFLSKIPEYLLEALKTVLQFVAHIIIGVLIFMVHIIALMLWIILMIIVHGISSVIDFVSNLNPFEGDNAPAKALWNALKTWGYIILTFVGLYAGFQWLFGEDTKAKKLIFNILLVALLINFTFLFVQEAFNIVWQIEKGVGSGSVGRIFLDKAIKTSPWSLANTIGGNRIQYYMPNEVELRSDFIGDLMGKLTDHIKLTSRSIYVNVTDGNALAQGLIKITLASLLSVVFTFIILLTAVIALALYVVRYFFITFLAAISSIAIASMAFPEIRIENKGFSLNLFDRWFSYFVKWILVIPVFLILFLASYNLLDNFIEEGGFEVGGSFPKLAQLIFSLIVIIGSFLLSIIFAEELSGKTAILARGFVLGASAYLGGLAVGKALRSSGNKVAGILEKTGGKITESPLPMALRARGIQLQKEAQNLRKNIYERNLANRQAVVGYHLETLRQAKNDQEKKEALRRLLGIIEGEKNPWMRTQLIRGLNLSDEDFEKILTDGKYADEARKILSLMGNPETPRESREWLAKRIRGLPAKKLLLASMNQTLYEMWDTLHAEVQKNFLEALENLKTEDLIKEFTKLKKNDWQNLYNLSQLYPNTYKAISESYNKASNNAFKGFTEAVVNNDISALRANIPFYPQISGHLDKIAGLIGPNNAQRLLIEGLRTAPVETIDNFYPTWFRLRSQQPQSPLVPGGKRIIKAFSNTGTWWELEKKQRIKGLAILSAKP